MKRRTLCATGVSDTIISVESKDVFSDLFVELAGFTLLSIPGYIMAQDWPRLTIAIGLCILFTRFAIRLRKQAYDKSK
jgi:Na+/proline symporter